MYNLTFEFQEYTRQSNVTIARIEIESYDFDGAIEGFLSRLTPNLRAKLKAYI